MRILVANRGEIALRIMRSIRDLGHESVAIYSRCDADSLHVKYADISVCVGDNPSHSSYLNVPNILSAATSLGIDAVHPGYGFLSEKSDFVRLLEQLNIKFIGPNSDVIDLMGDKINAIEAMKKAGVPVASGSDDIHNYEHLMDEVEKLGYPVIIKAAGGGGGKGLRIVEEAKDLEDSYYAVISEAKVTDPNPRVFVEKYIVDAKHIEVQILADNLGNVVHLGTRDCSMQRNNQKIIEEAPALINKDLEERMTTACVNAAKSIGYTSAGTFEFLVKDNDFYFLEMNTRLQVEHTVTEQITRVDIVAEQINAAFDLPLSFKQEDIKISRHSIECRINAEDPLYNFAPSPGKIQYLHLPGGFNIRNDFGVFSSSVIPPFYDSMIGKIIVTGTDREHAINNMRDALEEFYIDGVKTTVGFQKMLLNNEEFTSNRYTTTFLRDNFDDLIKDVENEN